MKSTMAGDCTVGHDSRKKQDYIQIHINLFKIGDYHDSFRFIYILYISQ